MTQSTLRKNHSPAQSVTSCWKESDMRRHELSHIDPNPFKCTKCNEQLRTQHSLEKHQVFHCEKAFSCNQCDAKFVKASGLKSHHERTKHSNKTPITITANVETNERVCNDPEIFKCCSCYLTFKTENALKAHEQGSSFYNYN